MMMAGWCLVDGRHTMPVGHILICDARGDVKHDDSALSIDVVTIAKTSKLFLSGSIPDIELDRTKILR